MITCPRIPKKSMWPHESYSECDFHTQAEWIKFANGIGYNEELKGYFGVIDDSEES